jgi:hypothetical protein
MDVIPEALKSSGQAIDEVVPPLFINVVDSQFTIPFVAREHMKGADHDCMGHGHDRPFLPLRVARRQYKADRYVPLVRVAAWASCVRPVRSVQLPWLVFPERRFPALLP